MGVYGYPQAQPQVGPSWLLSRLSFYTRDSKLAQEVLYERLFALEPASADRVQSSTLGFRKPNAQVTGYLGSASGVNPFCVLASPFL